MTSINIREALPEDSTDLATLTDIVAQEEIYIVPDRLFFTPDQQAQVLLTRQPDVHAVWVAETEGGRIVGECELVRGTWLKNQHTSNLAIIVHPEYRGHGVGTQLLGVAEAQAREWGVSLLWLTVFASNTRAQRLYAQIGYTLDAILPRRYYIQNQWVDECVMSKEIRKD